MWEIVFAITVYDYQPFSLPCNLTKIIFKNHLIQAEMLANQRWYIWDTVTTLAMNRQGRCWLPERIWYLHEYYSLCIVNRQTRQLTSFSDMQGWLFTAAESAVCNTDGADRHAAANDWSSAGSLEHDRLQHGKSSLLLVLVVYNHSLTCKNISENLILSPLV